MATPELARTDRTALRRHPERGSHDRAQVEAILDDGYVAHVGFTVAGEPRVLPMAYGRIDDVLYLHGAVGNAMLRASDGAPVCVTVTHLDGLVAARSQYHHSMNYRSVVLVGRAEKVTDDEEKAAALAAIVDQALPGRSRVARPASPGEARATLVLRLPIAEGSAKVRAGGPVDEPEDMDLEVWAGVVPLRVVAGAPVQDPLQEAVLAPPEVRAPTV